MSKDRPPNFSARLQGFAAVIMGLTVALFYGITILEGLWGIAEGMESVESPEPLLEENRSLDSSVFQLIVILSPVAISLTVILAAYLKFFRWVAVVALFIGFSVSIFLTLVESPLYIVIVLGYGLCVCVWVVSLVRYKN